MLIWRQKPFVLNKIGIFLYSYYRFNGPQKHDICEANGDWRLGGPPFGWDIPKLSGWEIPTGDHDPCYGMFTKFNLFFDWLDSVSCRLFFFMNCKVCGDHSFNLSSICSVNSLNVKKKSQLGAFKSHYAHMRYSPTT